MSAADSNLFGFEIRFRGISKVETQIRLKKVDFVHP